MTDHHPTRDSTVPAPPVAAGGQPPVSLEVLEAEICALAGHLAAANCRFLELIGDFDARRGWAEWDMSSCAAWLSWKCQMASGTAREHVRVARAMRELPVIRGEFAAGRFSYAKVRALTRIATPDSDGDLAEMAAPMTANQLERFARAHRTITAAEDEQVRLSRRLTWRHNDDGSLSLSVRLPPEDGAAVLTALRAAVTDAPPSPHDVSAGTSDAIARSVSAETPPAPAGPDDLLDPGRPRPTSTSLADALVELAETYLAGKTRDAQNPDVYQVIIHATPDALAPAASGAAAPGTATPVTRCHIEDGPAISPATLQAIACDAVLSWISHDTHGNALNAGRRRREPGPALRRALRDRDQGRCQRPGCGRRASQAHHITWWAHGGPTSLDNLISLCKRCHRQIHHGHLAISITGPDEFTFLLRDGTPLDTCPPLPAPGQPGGSLDRLHDAEITPDTIIPAWYGERLDLDFALTILFANQETRRARQASQAA